MYLAQNHIPAELESEVFPDLFSNWLTEKNYLNAWQAQQLLAGHTKFNLGSYRIVNSLGQGGMGQVFLGCHSMSQNEVAIKVLPRDKSTPAAIENFQREIQVLSMLHHPNIVGALDAGEDGNVYFLVCEYVPGQNLRKLIRNGRPLTMKSAASIISQASLGLQHAHEKEFVHRDVKPGNILVTPQGVTKLTDFGLAGAIGGKNDPRAGKIVGTADYLSPDQVRSPWNPVPAWDIYSLGCTLYYAVTGKVPFPGGTTLEKARAHCDLLPLDPRLLNPTLDTEFVDVIADMMAKDPQRRIPSAFSVVERLAKWSPPLPTSIEMVDGAEIEAAQINQKIMETSNSISRKGNPALQVKQPVNNDEKFEKNRQKLQINPTASTIEYSPMRHPGFSASEELITVEQSEKEMEQAEKTKREPPVWLPALLLFMVTPIALTLLMLLLWKLFS